MERTKPHILKHKGQWVVRKYGATPWGSVSAAVRFVDRLNAPVLKAKELELAVDLWRALP